MGKLIENFYYNNLSIFINGFYAESIREKNPIIGDKLDSFSASSRIEFVGAVIINSDNIQEKFEIIPLRLEIIK